MIKGVFIVNACGGLIYESILESAFPAPVEIDKLIALASTIYTAIEILTSVGVCRRDGKYAQLTVRYTLSSVTALKTQTGLIFVVIHDHTDSPSKVTGVAEKMHKMYVEKVLPSPEYSVDGRIPKKILRDIF